ncbi:2,3-bisphosphoglycerate-independent phosphoglycerate mutase-domain-containing protein [Radiomyces spectabilis]|uniref:2,3-bisphosphoglycerate-independent phosphoglycerate mutase-domain-containing protein n=1 Tax=Radiomyces spectabilis TaxID=64574 RepID=UPI002220E4F9|nr:2,3-bisphosphoglycerate-independent phosphoglycerate mutase-domain-containing protein [Radiomyces spectabilis]KAI8380913.1 2,3-bisphosphoglycerate-independent phosphoglycerate mutase-domain-containing protein [Radiomyces spectabilis]
MSPPHKKLLLVLIDGIGDVAVPELEMRTPLQAAKTPWMDKLASSGLNGLMDSVEPGLACGSDTAHMSILGYNPRQHYRGRGAFETMGAGLEMQPGDIAFKSNFAYMDRESGIVISRRADRQFEGLGPVLCEALDGVKLPSFPDHTVAVRYATEHRCGVRVRGPGLTDTITGTDPLKDNKPLVKCAPTENTDEARMTSKLINELSDAFYDILSGHPINETRRQQDKNPANCVLLRGCGSCIDIPSIEALHGFKSFLIAPTCIIAGLGMTARMDILQVEGATGDYQTNFQAKADAAVRAITSEYDFGFLHIKAVDDAGHDRHVSLKVNFLEKVDAMIGNIMTRLATDEQINDNKYTIIITSDHSTPVLYGDHSCEPVPVCVGRVNGQGCSDNVHHFDEISAMKGGLGRFCGEQLMTIAKNYMRTT